MSDDEVQEPAGLEKVVRRGNRRASLVALRNSLARAIDNADADKVAPLAKQLRDTLDALEAIPAAKEKSTVDDLTTRRAARRSDASVSAGAAGQVVGGAGDGGPGGERRPGAGSVAGGRPGRGAGGTP